MSTLPNPFFSSPGRLDLLPVETAVASPQLTGTVDAAADHRFVLDEVAFMEAIEPLPLFLQAPIAVLEVLAGY